MGGLFGAVTKSDCLIDLFYGTDYHSHLGTVRGGLVVRNEKGFKRNIHDITNTPFRTKFEEDLPKLHGSMGIGVISDYEDQPLLIGSHHGTYAIVTVGRINNSEELAQKAMEDRAAHFCELKSNEINPTEVVAALINKGATIPEGIHQAQAQIDGSCTILILTKNEVFAARDKMGRTPLVVGKKDDAYAVTMETCAFPNLGYRVDRELGPGEVVRITERGVKQMVAPQEKMQICSFLWVYYGYPASSYQGQNAEDVRNRCGACLARRDDITTDFVAGIPDSGIGHAIGYAMEAKIPYRRPFVKYTPTWPRSFMPQDQTVRNLVAKMKLIPVHEFIEGKNMLFLDDSLVRGTQLKDIITRMYDYGANEVHMRPACPPLIFGCKFLNFSRSKSEMDLAARKAVDDLEGGEVSPEVLAEYADHTTERYTNMVEWIRNYIGLTTLKYQRLDDLIEAIGLPQDQLCTYCWTGKDPSC